MGLFLGLTRASSSILSTAGSSLLGVGSSKCSRAIFMVNSESNFQFDYISIHFSLKFGLVAAETVVERLNVNTLRLDRLEVMTLCLMLLSVHLHPILSA